MDHRQKPAAVWEWPLQQGDGLVRTYNRGDAFDVQLDVPYFSDRDVKVDAREHDLHIHCESENPRRLLDRTYHLPSDVDAQSVKSYVTRDGRISIWARKGTNRVA